MLHCGTNNLVKDNPIAIVNGILSIGMDILDRHEKMSILIAGILHRESRLSNNRNIICDENSKFYYVDVSEGWTDKLGDLKSSLFIYDKIHLTKEGNEKLSIAIAKTIKDIPSTTNNSVNIETYKSLLEEFPNLPVKGLAMRYSTANNAIPYKKSYASVIKSYPKT